MKKKQILTAALLVFAMAAVSIVEAASFVIRDIRVEGLQRVSVGTVFNNIPYEVGQTVSDNAAGEIIRSLYATGLFKDVSLQQDGGILVVTVVERPTIDSITITGNKDIDSDQLKQGLRDAGFAEGRVYNEFVLDKIKQDLKRSYFDRGKYGVIITSTVSPLERNRVALELQIREGVTARIKRINIVGNEDFDEDDITDEMELSTSGIFSRFTKNDQYSAQKLQADLESIRSFYLDRGYITFDVESTQVNITPEKEDVFLTINIKEGDVYTITDIKLAGKVGANPEEFYPLIELRRGEPFSRKDVLRSAERLTQALSDKGYAFANVNPVPDVNEEEKTVVVTFYVEPGKRVYVRNINITGNTRSRDRVLRREFRQVESSWYSAEKVRESKERLERLGYFSKVEISTTPVAGSTDEVDIDVNVEEKKSRELLLGAGYSQSGGISFQAKLSDDNFFGTGKRVSIGFNTSSVNTYYELAYNNPYFTIDGISQGFILRYQETDLGELNSTNTANYAFDRGTIGVNFGFPITENDRITTNLLAEYTKLQLTSGASTEITDYYSDGDSFYIYKLNTAWIHDTRDRAYFPTEGSQIVAELGIAIPGSDFNFYKLSYEQKSYFPLTDDLTFAIRGEIAAAEEYGDSTVYPFFENYYAGGPGSVRGYESYSLSSFRDDPNKSTVDSNGDAFGGKMRVTGSLELWFPPPFWDEEGLRFVAFVDGGNVYKDYNTFSASELRYSAGLGVSWLSPFGLLNFSYAYPYNDQPGDDIEEFQFTFGTNF